MIHSICVAKNEADIIRHSLTEAAKWSDRIFVLDNGSEDATWEIVQELKSDVVIPWKRDERTFGDGLRGEVFNHFRREARAGDWWCRFDADEFYPDDPRRFLNQVPHRHHVVWGTAIEFYLTNSDVKSLDFSQPLQDLLPKIRHYRAVNSEARFFRHRDGLDWPATASWPRHVGIVHPKRIPFFHYKFRSPEQIQRRLATRRDAVERGCRMYWSEQAADWQNYLVTPESCEVLHNGSLRIDDTKLPRHLEPFSRRLVKILMHGIGVWP